ncbi:uncharacterized protein LOC119710779 [Motacilla alba alba]|uniref:uncharacterized protein LOC119710779 n=1 Tax=Motacilla alba alba TaxID=1094192 RepID=UPI0018D57A4C|nr:uncharacterized protein LOC119710779 [Motacilla alba alba]
MRQQGCCFPKRRENSAQTGNFPSQTSCAVCSPCGLPGIPFQNPQDPRHACRGMNLAPSLRAVSGKDSAAPSMDEQGGEPQSLLLPGLLPACSPLPSISFFLQRADASGRRRGFTLLGWLLRPTCPSTHGSQAWLCVLPAHANTPEPVFSPGFGPGERSQLLQPRAGALACSSHRWPQSSLQLPSPKWLFLSSWNFLLALIFILYLFSSAENWHLMCPARLCGCCWRLAPGEGHRGAQAARRAVGVSPGLPPWEICLPAALHPLFLPHPRAFPSWSAGCSKPCTYQHPTFDEACRRTMLQLWELPQALQISQKPELLVAALTLTVVFQELDLGPWPWVQGLQSVSVRTSAVGTKWHTDQKAYDKTIPVAITQMWSLSSLIASFGAEIAAGRPEIIGIQSVVKPHVRLTIQAGLHYGRCLAGE